MIDLDRYAAEHPAPLRDEASAPFFEAAAGNRLLIPRCDNCNRWLPPAWIACPTCLSQALTWTQATGKGRVFTWTVIHNAPPAFRGDVPYVIAEIELDEGPHLEARLLGVAVDRLRLDLPVEAAFCHPPEGDSYPVFLAVPEVP